MHRIKTDLGTPETLKRVLVPSWRVPFFRRKRKMKELWLLSRKGTPSLRFLWQGWEMPIFTFLANDSLIKRFLRYYEKTLRTKPGIETCPSILAFTNGTLECLKEQLPEDNGVVGFLSEKGFRRNMSQSSRHTMHWSKTKNTLILESLIETSNFLAEALSKVLKMFFTCKKENYIFHFFQRKWK